MRNWDYLLKRYITLLFPNTKFKKNLFALHAHIDCNINLIRVAYHSFHIKGYFLCDNILYNLLCNISRDFNIFT